MIFTILLSLTDAFAVPLQLTQQGRMIDSNGLSITGLHILTFRVYDDLTAGNMLWEDYMTTDFNNGYYASVLGSDVQNNPLDSAVLSLYPLYLEVQLDNNSPLSPRQSINSTPYAQIAGIAESVEGGTVNADEVSINGNTVIDATGTWVGSITVDWADINVPPEFLDGDDNTQLSETQVETFINNGPIDLNPSTTMNGSGLLTQADTLIPDWANIQNIPPEIVDGDDDSLSSLGCTQGEIVGWDGLNWVCVSDNTLDANEVGDLLTNNAYDLNGATTIGGFDILTTVDDADTLGDLSCINDGEIARYDLVLDEWYCDTDDDTQLSESDVETYITNGTVDLYAGTTLDGNSILTNADTLTPEWANLQNIPSDIADGDDDTQLSESDVESFVTNGSVNLYAGTTLDGNSILTNADTLTPDWTNLQSIPSDIADGDDDTQLSESDVETYITNGSVNLYAGTTIGGDTIVSSAGCSDGEVLTYNASLSSWECSTFQSFLDVDGDGVMAWVDCDDTNASILSMENDGDCDGVLTPDDCDDSDSSSTIVAEDEDCDGTLTADDCDDTDPSSNILAIDQDCDGALTQDDCDDNDDARSPYYIDICNDGIDNDCDGSDDLSCLSNYNFSAHTFTTCGRTGTSGPSYGNCLSEYSSSSWSQDVSNFNVSSGVQLWVVPTTGTYRITVRGAQGGPNFCSNRGGYGAEVEGEFTLTKDDTINIIVGQMGTQSPSGNCANGGSGGGGGSFVWVNVSSVPLIVAGGGGGSSLTNNGYPNYEGGPGLSSDPAGASRSGQNGGSGGANGSNNGGMGWNTVQSSPNGLTTNGTYNGTGGFGGGGRGGGSCGAHVSGAGGGFSGGGAGSCYYAAGGGSSYNDGTNQSNTSDTNSGHGSVILTFVN